MLIPIGDAPAPRSTPFVTWLVVAVNVAAYVLVSLPLSAQQVDLRDARVRDYLEAVVPPDAPRGQVIAIIEQLSAYDLFVYEHGFRPAAPGAADLLASLFLHANLLHLAGNMLFLWIYGKNVEHRIGHVGFALAYLGCGVLATLSHGAVALGSPLPTIGASGAISGVLGLHFIWFPRNMVRVLLLLPPVFLDVLVLPARLVLGAYLVLDNLLPFLITGGQGGGVAYGAHIGGFFAGMGVAWVLDRRERLRGPSGDAFETERTPALEPGAAREALIGLVHEGRIAEAANAYFALPAAATRGLLPPLAAVELARGLRRQARPDLAITVLRRAIHDAPGDAPGLAEAYVAAGLIELHDLERPAEAYRHLLAALERRPGPEVERAAYEGLAAIQASHRFGLGSRGAR